MSEPISSFEWAEDIHYSGSIPEWMSEPGPWAPGAETVVRVTEVQPANPASHATMPDGTVVTVGVPLREIRATLGGDEGYWLNPATGEQVFVSIKKFKHRDPDTTLLRLEFLIKHQPKNA